MKRCVGAILVFFFHFAQAQKPAAELHSFDWFVQGIPVSSPDSLALKLTERHTTEREKARAIYSWICRNIRYNTEIYRPLTQRARFVPEPLDTTSEWKSADEMVAQKVLRRGKAVCDGYARLFKVLCEYAGLKAVVVNGYVRTGFGGASERFKTNHTWNAVWIDSAWQLVDATWGAGFVTYANEFVQQQNDFYFLTPPEDLIRDHYPEELRWTLLPNPPSLAEFRKMPFRSKSFIKYDIQAYAPASGVVEAGPGDTLSFTLHLKDAKKARSTIPDPFLDTSSFSLSPFSVFIKPVHEADNKAYYYFVVDGSTKWVHLLFNDDVILRYQVNRRQALASK